MVLMLLRLLWPVLWTRGHVDTGDRARVVYLSLPPSPTTYDPLHVHSIIIVLLPLVLVLEQLLL